MFRLVSMPFVSARRPSIQLGLLKSILAQQGIECTTHHLNLYFAEDIGLPLYEAICEHRGTQIGDWVFARSAFGGDAPPITSMTRDVFSPTIESINREVELAFEELVELRDHVAPRFLREMASLLDWSDSLAVGFTSTFQQNVASLAMARLIKATAPNVKIIFGGANCEVPMGQELLRSFPWVDYVVAGEGDDALPGLLRCLMHGEDPENIPNVLRSGALPQLDFAPEVVQSLSQCVPDYDEYFSTSIATGVLSAEASVDVTLPIETARGCWWGERQHCTFCGLNGSHMRYRSKPPEAVLSEVSALSTRYKSFFFAAVDNILDFGYFDTLVPMLAQAGLGYSFFYETKSNLSKQRIRLLWQSGIRMVQPGIESLSTDILALIKKGVSGPQNICALKWLTYYGIRAYWNLLWGFPGEEKAWYDAQAALIPRLTHLQPPQGMGRIRLERFSPLFRERGLFKLIKHERSYAEAYPIGVNLDQIAYFFDYELRDAVPSEAYENTRLAGETWSAMWAEAPTPPYLKYRASPHYIRFYDGRDPDNLRTIGYSGSASSVYRIVDEKPISVRELMNRIEGTSSSEVLGWLDLFEEQGLVVRENGRVFGLATPDLEGR